MDISEAGEKFKELLKSENAPGFTNKGPYPEYVKLFNTCVMDAFKIKWEALDISIDGFYCLRLQDDKIKYLVIGPDSYMWCDKEMENSMPLDDVFIYLFKTYHGIDAEIDSNRNVRFFKDGKPIVLNLPGRGAAPRPAPRAGGRPADR